MSSHSPLARTVGFVLNNSILLLVGTTAAVVWANLDNSSYDRVAHALHFWVNDVGMAFFFALAAKEVFEATLPGGALASVRKAVSPLLAALGGMAAPALIYVTLVITYGPHDLLGGWAIPTATDIAFSAMVARLIFPRAHPAIPFLLLLAIVDDALGLVILALFYPSGALSFGALVGYMSAALLLVWGLRRRRTRSFWPYIVGPGALSWAALHFGGFHPALALVPIVPFMPHSERDLGIFHERESRRRDTLSQFEHWWAIPVQVVLFAFGLANAGVSFGQTGPGTYYVVAALLIGKPLGICLAAAMGRLAGAHLPSGLRPADVLLVGIIASVGFTVSLFFATAAFSEGAALAQTKMGALFSFAAVPLALSTSGVLSSSRRRRAHSAAR